MYSLEAPQIQICSKIFVHDFMKLNKVWFDIKAAALSAPIPLLGHLLFDCFLREQKDYHSKTKINLSG